MVTNDGYQRPEMVVECGDSGFPDSPQDSPHHSRGLRGTIELLEAFRSRKCFSEEEEDLIFSSAADALNLILDTRFRCWD